LQPPRRPRNARPVAAKAAAERKAAAAKAAEERKLAQAKAAEERKAAAKAKADAALAAKLAKEKAQEEARLAKLKAIEDAKQAKIRAAEAARQAEIARLTSMEVAKTGNNGELRSETAAAPKQTGFLGLFSSTPKASMLAETRALDAVLEQRDAKKKFRVKEDFEPRTVEFPGYHVRHHRHRYVVALSLSRPVLVEGAPLRHCGWQGRTAVQG
jgi:hypothetical protein